MTWDERIAAYLDGDLDRPAAREVERALVDPAVAALLGEELMLRALLAQMPPEGPPAALYSRIEDALGVRRQWLRPRLPAFVRRPTGVGEDGLVDWARRAPAAGRQTVALARAGFAGARLAVSGVSTVRASVERMSALPRVARSPGWPTALRAAFVSLGSRRRK